MKFFIIVMLICLPAYGMEVGKNLTFRKPLDEQADELNFLLDRIILNLTGRVSFADGEISDGEDGENLDCQFRLITDSGAANVEFAVTHTLGRIPVGYTVIKNDSNGVIYDGTSTWTTTTIYLRSSAANASMTIMLF